MKGEGDGDRAEKEHRFFGRRDCVLSYKDILEAGEDLAAWPKWHREHLYVCDYCGGVYRNIYRHDPVVTS